MDLTVVVPTFNSAACVRSCIDSVRVHLPRVEVVVVDNASEDETTRIVSAAAPDGAIIANAENQGFGRACNSGAHAATRGNILFLNPDVVITHSEPEALERLLETSPFGLVGPEASASTGDIGARREPSLLQDWLEQTLGMLRPRELPHRRRRRAGMNGDAWLSGSMLLANRAEFLRLGGFDPRFFLYYEDRDLAVRYRKAELPIRLTAALAGTHVGTASSGPDTLRVAPAGWAFLGWIEYVYLHRGERAARVSAQTGLVTLRTMRAATSAVGRVFRTERLERKRMQLARLLLFLDEIIAAGPQDDGFCPDAVRLMQATG